MYTAMNGKQSPISCTRWIEQEKKNCCRISISVYSVYVCEYERARKILIEYFSFEKVRSLRCSRMIWAFKWAFALVFVRIFVACAIIHKFHDWDFVVVVVVALSSSLWMFRVLRTEANVGRKKIMKRVWERERESEKKKRRMNLKKDIPIHFHRYSHLYFIFLLI